MFLGLQEISGHEDIQAIARSAAARYQRNFQTLFVKGKHAATGPDVGALFDTSKGWGVYGRPSRVSALEKQFSTHMVVRLTNSTATLDLCLVDLQHPSGKEGAESSIAALEHEPFGQESKG